MMVVPSQLIYLKEHSFKLFDGHCSTRQTVRRVLKAAQRILSASKDIPAKHLRHRVQIDSSAEHPEEEAVLWDWFKDLRSCGIPVSGDLLKTKMAEIFTQ